MEAKRWHDHRLATTVVSEMCVDRKQLAVAFGQFAVTLRCASDRSSGCPLPSLRVLQPVRIHGSLRVTPAMEAGLRITSGNSASLCLRGANWFATHGTLVSEVLVVFSIHCVVRRWVALGVSSRLRCLL